MTEIDISEGVEPSRASPCLAEPGRTRPSLAYEPSLSHRLFRETANILGQDKARKQMAVLLERQAAVAAGELDKSGGALVAGRTGTGKTMLARTMCQLSGLPFAEVNATQYTERGYVGQDLPQMYLPLLQAAAQMVGLAPEPEREEGEEKEKDERPIPTILKRPDMQQIIDLAQTGVILLDEADKWLQRYNHVTGKLDTAIQTEILKMVEGSIEYVSDNTDEVGVPIDTSRILILYTGAFVGLSDVVRKRLKMQAGQYNEESFWDLIEPGDFVRMGIIPELAGRLATHIFLRPLRAEHLYQIMDAPGGPVAEYRQRFESFGIEWAVPQEALVSLAAKALERNTGARGVEHVMWGCFSEALFAASMAEAPGRVTLAVNHVKAQVQV